MRSDELINIFGVFLALLHLKKQGKPHSTKNIADCMKGVVSNNVIGKAIDNLEKWRVIVHPKGLTKGERQGQTYTFDIFPHRLPKFVIEVTVSDKTNERHRERAKARGLGRLKYGELLFDANGFLKQVDDQWVEDVDYFARSHFPHAHIDRKWLREKLEGGKVTFSNQPILAFLEMLRSLKKN